MVSGRDGAQLETRSTRSDPVTAGATPQFASQVRAQVTVYIGRYPRGATGGDDIPMRADARELIYQLAFEARASALAEIRRQLTELLAHADCSATEIQSVVIALNEACMNIIQHAYHGDSSQPIRLHIDVDDQEVRFELLDDAAPIDLARVCGRSFQELRPGGLGVNVIIQLMHDVRYSHRTEGAGNCLRMTFKRRS